MKYAPICFVALALACAGCAAPRHASVAPASGGAESGAALQRDDLRDSPALSSTAAIPRPYRAGAGSATNYFDGLNTPTAPSPASHAGVTSPLVGVVPGGSPWP